MSFDPNQFMNTPTETMSTQMTVCPEGEYPFVIDSGEGAISVKHLQGVGRESGKPYDFHQMEVNCVCVDEAVKQKLNRQKVTVRLRVNLDINQAGMLEVGPDKNVGLGRLREALNQNQPGWKPAQLMGAGPFIGKVEHSTNKGNIYAEISRVTKVS